VGDSALKKGWITPVTCQFDVLLSPILVLVLCSMFFDPFEPLINVLILPANSLALVLVQKLRERQIKRPALIQHRGQWWVAEIPEVNEDGSRMDGSSPDIAATVQAPEPRPKTAATPQDLERMFNAPSAQHEATVEIEEDTIETVSSLASVQSTFPNWKPKSQDVAAKIVDWLAGRADKNFSPSEVKKSIRLLKDDATLTADRLKKLLDLLTEKQFLSCDETGRYAIGQSAQQTDDYDF